MLSTIKPSYDFNIPPIPTIQESFELNPDITTTKNSYDFLPGGGTSGGVITDYVKASIGGTFFGIIRYDIGVSPTGDDDIPDILWTKNYVDGKISELQLGGLSQGTVRTWFSATSPILYDSLTGIFSLDTRLSLYTNDIGFLTSFTETDPTVGSHIKSILSTDITNWNAAFSWGNHALAGYKTVVTQTDVTQHQAALAITTSQITDFSTHNHNLKDLVGFPTVYSANQLFRVNSTGVGFEFITFTHSMLSGINDSTDYQHLTTAQKNKIIQPATNLVDGYMTAVQVQKLESALTQFSVGPHLTFANNLLTLNSEILPVDDSTTSTLNVWSSQKIVDYLGSLESPDTGSFLNVRTIKLVTGTTIAQRITGLVEGTDYPTGWTLAADGADLVITHNLDKMAILVTVLSINGTTQSAVALQGNVAYSSYTNEYVNSRYDKLRISALGGGGTVTHIKIGF